MKIDAMLLETQLNFSAWASERVIDSAQVLAEDELGRDLGSSYGGVFGTLTHIFQADRIWLSRLKGTPRTTLTEADESMDLGELTSAWKDVWQGWRDWVRSVDDVERVLSYVNLKGERFSLPYWQVVFHVVNHASYHRGQITTMLRQLGYTPVGTDLHTFYLKGGAKATGG
jgi:uncharacterized damage-inducible protein DinB